MRRQLGIAALVLAASVLAVVPTHPATAASAAQFTQPCGNPGTPGQVHHVIWIWMEN
jgi:hypothetical protein